ncbi:putative E2F/DP family, winged-helix DNA-binding domain-containing protein [Plasmopara halstedii]
MKTHRAHKRKLHFSAKDFASLVTVKVNHVPQRPLKRRKRQSRSRHVSPTSTINGKGLSATIWSQIQDQFAAAKSLGEITRIVLHFFTEHEHLQGSSSDVIFPIFVPSSEIYKMKVPRKRRIYDVLHVLEGISVIKRVRYDERRGTNGGYFLYYGKSSVVQHLAEMKSRSSQVMAEFRQTRHLHCCSIVEKDSALVSVFEKQAAADKWPCLVTMTVCFLGLLFQQDYKTGVGLPAISARLVDAKTFIGSLIPSASTEAPYRDVHRRVYDVVSVLVSCNIIDTSPVPCSESIDKGLRKYVRFNYEIFTNPRVLFATIDSLKYWKSKSVSSLTSSDVTACFGELESPNAKSLRNNWPSPSLEYWQSLHDDLALASSTVFSPISVNESDASRIMQPSANSNSAGLRDVPDPQLPPSLRVILRPAKQPSCLTQKFFSPLGKMTTISNKWNDDSLKHLGLHDVVPAVDKIDWKSDMQLQENCCEMWGLQHSQTAPADICEQQHQYWVDGINVKLTDLECSDVLVDDDINSTSSYFC